MIVPPIPLYTMHGNPDTSSGLVYKRVVFVDESGVPLVTGNEPSIDKEFRPGDKSLVPATRYSDFIGISDCNRHSLDRAAIPATPGWRCVFGCRFDDGEYETWTREVAAWSVDSGMLHPITLDDDTCLIAVDQVDTVNVRLIKILEPGTPVPCSAELEKLAREALPSP